MDDLKDPQIEWDEIRNRNMCRFIVGYALACFVAVCLVAWLAR